MSFNTCVLFHPTADLGEWLQDSGGEEEAGTTGA